MGNEAITAPGNEETRSSRCAVGGSFAQFPLFGVRHASPLERRVISRCGSKPRAGLVVHLGRPFGDRRSSLRADLATVPVEGVPTSEVVVATRVGDSNPLVADFVQAARARLTGRRPDQVIGHSPGRSVGIGHPQAAQQHGQSSTTKRKA
jgi:hypothetical protein